MHTMLSSTLLERLFSSMGNCNVFISFLVDRWLSASSCRPSVRLSVCDALTLQCIAALRVGVQG